MDAIFIVGSSGHAKVVIDIVEREQRWRIAGLIDRFRPIGETTLGHAVLGGESECATLAAAHGVRGIIVAIGDNAVRLRVAGTLAASCPGIGFVSTIHPSASIAREVVIGAGTVVMSGVTVNPGCSIGQHGLLNTHASLDHDSTMEDGASLAPKAATGGHCRLGLCAAVGIGATLAHRVHIGAHTVIGAGATVLRDIGPLQVAYGTPARPVRTRAAGDPYL